MRRYVCDIDAVGLLLGVSEALKELETAMPRRATEPSIRVQEDDLSALACREQTKRNQKLDAERKRLAREKAGHNPA